MSTRRSPGSRYFKRVILTAILCISNLISPPHKILAQTSVRRPCIGLVLSGGGACGLAHIGLLKVMEEAGLRPDFITGVSMGSIIGGLYSIGYNSDSLEKIVKIINWDNLFSNKIPENKITFSEKRHYLNSIISFPVTFKRVVLPSGLINGQQIEMTLGYYTWPAADINDFSNLPIPFMCLAMDLVKCQRVELKHGYLADAMRASMAVPSVMTPVKLDSLWLIDGGFLRNFAASEVHEMGADIVIGSYAGGKFAKEDKLQTAPDILKQLGFYASVIDYKEEKKLVNYLIEPPLDEFIGTEFDKADTIIQRGYKAAVPFREIFRKLADSLNKIAPQKMLKNIINKIYYTFDKIEINGNKIHSDNQIFKVLDISPGEQVDKNLLKENMELLYGKVWFEKVNYSIIKRNDSLILVINCVEKPRAIIYGSVHYDEALQSGAIIGLTVNNLLSDRSVIDLNSSIGQYYRLQFDYSQFADRYNKFGFSANIYADNTLLPMVLVRGDQGNFISRNLYMGISLVKRFGLNHMMNISARYDVMNLIPDFITSEHLNKLGYNYLTFDFEYNINTLDNKHFPNDGIIFNLSASTSKLLSATSNTDSTNMTFRETSGSSLTFKRFYTFNASYRQYFSPSRKITFSVGGEALFITNSDSISSQNNFYLLGGIVSVSKRSIPMVGFHANEIYVKKLAGVCGEMDFELFPSFHLNLMANLFALQEKEPEETYSFLAGYGIGAGYMSVVGPLRIGIMQGLNNKNSYFKQLKGFISLGYNF
jgi:NTE family protein